jgi:pimeloyl-ACP methyl ester carboxylesterase
MTYVPTLLVPGLLCSPRLYAEQVPALWRFGPVMVASHHHDDSLAASARRVLEAAPPRFALAGLAMGGYLAFEVMRQVLVVTGADDDITTTTSHAAEIADGIPGARLTVIPDCGHLSTLEQPAAVTQALVGWLAD